MESHEPDSEKKRMMLESIREGVGPGMDRISRVLEMLSSQVAMAEAIAAMGSRIAVNEARLEAQEKARTLAFAVTAPVASVLIALFGWALLRGQASIDTTVQLVHEQQVQAAKEHEQSLARDQAHELAIKQLQEARK